MYAMFWTCFAFLVVFGRVASASGISGEAAACPRVSTADAILPPPRESCLVEESPVNGFEAVGVVEGDEAALQRALNLVYKNRDEYVAVLFHASWCPFSKICRPNFNYMASMFPTIRHFAFEESVIRPSILHGTTPASENPASVGKIADILELNQTIDKENCPFSWARSPEKLLQQDTYLALASFFVLLRLLYFLMPKLNACINRACRRYMQYASLLSLWDHFHAYLQEAKQSLNRLNPCKRSNLQEGAMNAKAWASKSLASVSIGEPSTSRAQSTS